MNDGIEIFELTHLGRKMNPRCEAEVEALDMNNIDERRWCAKKMTCTCSGELYCRRPKGHEGHHISGSRYGKIVYARWLGPNE